MVTYKQMCVRCKKNFVLVSRNQFPICYDCQRSELNGEVKDKKMKKLFDIPEELYKKNSFLREIKLKYLKFGALSEKQIEVFARVAKELQGEKAPPPAVIPPVEEPVKKASRKKPLKSKPAVADASLVD